MRYKLARFPRLLGCWIKKVHEPESESAGPLQRVDAADLSRFASLHHGVLVEVAASASRAWLVFEAPSGPVAVLARRDASGWGLVWSSSFAKPQRVSIAAARLGSGGEEGWFVVWRDGLPEAVQHITAAGDADALALLGG